MKNKKITIGIDLGTTNSLSSYIKDKKPEIIINERGSRTTSSVVSFKNNKEVFIGELARNQALINAKQTISNVKLQMGTDTKYTPFGREYTPVEISALILRKIKQNTESYLGKSITDTVITVPAYFSDNQRLATLKAGFLAGFTDLKLLNEPVAAALAYYLNKKQNENILVVDFGGGTLDITLMSFNENVFQVKGTEGSTSLGGINIDTIIADFIAEEFYKQYSIHLKEDPIAFQQILINSEKAKIDLSSSDEVTIFIPYITATDKGPIHLNVELTRTVFERLLNPVIVEITKHVTAVFEKSKLPISWVTSVIFAGGSTRIPVVEKKVVEILNTQSSKNKIKIYRDINPDEVVAMGAGVLAGILSGEIDEVNFYDITTYDLGIEDDDGEFINIIPANTNYPTDCDKLFTTTKDNQEEVFVKIIQRDIHKKTVHLGSFKLKNIKKAKAGEPSIDVIFKINSLGILNVTAVDLDTEEFNDIEISERDWLITDTKCEKRGSSLKIL